MLRLWEIQDNLTDQKSDWHNAASIEFRQRQERHHRWFHHRIFDEQIVEIECFCPDRWSGKTAAWARVLFTIIRAQCRWSNRRLQILRHNPDNERHDVVPSRDFIASVFRWSDNRSIVAEVDLVLPPGISKWRILGTVTVDTCAMLRNEPFALTIAAPYFLMYDNLFLNCSALIIPPFTSPYKKVIHQLILTTNVH